MHYDQVLDKWHEECGVFGIFDRTLEVARYVYCNTVANRVRVLPLLMAHKLN